MSIAAVVRKGKTEWHNLWEQWEAGRFTRAPSGLSRWLTDGVGLAGPLTSWFSTAGRPHSPSAGPLILFYHFQSHAMTSQSHTGTTVTCSWQRSKSSQRNAIAAWWWTRKLRVCKGWVAEGWLINLTWELGMRFVTAWNSPTWISLHQPPVVSTLSTCCFNAASWSLAPHLCFMSSFLLFKASLLSFTFIFCITHIANSLYLTPPSVLFRITRQSLPSVIYAHQNTTLRPSLKLLI